MCPTNLKGTLAVCLMMCCPLLVFGQTDTWNGGTGNWSNGSMWSGGEPGTSSNVAIDGGNSVASSVTLDISAAINSLTIDSDDKLSFSLNTQLTVNGGSISNAGQMTINAGSATNSELTLGANTTLSGGGTVTLSSTQSGGGAAFIQGNGTTLTTNNTIQGDGIIGNGSLALVNQATGIIDADSAGGTFLTVLDLNGSGGVTNAGLLEATNKGVLEIQNTVNNTGGNITANGLNATVQLVGAYIEGGTLNTKSGGTLITPNGNASTLDGTTKGALTLSSGSTYTSDFNTTTNILGTINNNGNFQLNGGSATNTALNLIGNTTLQGVGGGKVTLSSTVSGGGAAFIEGNNFTLTNTNNIIQGDGIIGNGSLALVNQAGGTIDANSAGGSFLNVLVLNGSGGVTNAGLLEATANGILQIENTVNNSGGNITAGGSSAVVQLQAADIQGGTLNNKRGGMFLTPNGNSSTLDGTTKGALTLSTGSTYTSDFNTITNILGTINNNGNFQLNGGDGTNTHLTLAGNTTLQGTGGTVTLNSPQTNGGAAFIDGSGFTLTNTNNVIQGGGYIGNGSLVLVNQSGGTVDANVAGGGLILNGSGNVINTGLLEATNSGSLVIENTVNNSGGNITANGGTVALMGANIQGGTLNSVGGGILITGTGNAATLDGSTHGALTLSTGSTYTSDFNTTTNVVGAINNNGNIQLNGGNATNTALNLVGSTTLQGSGGKVTLSSTTTGGGAAYIEGNGQTLTNTNNVIQGDGYIGNGSLTLVNQAGGTIDANSAGGTFDTGLVLNGSGNVSNAGLLESTNNGLLVIQNAIENSGGNITANGSGATVQLMGADIQGGTLNTKNGGTFITSNGNSSTLDGVTQGALTLSAGSTYTSDFNTTTNVVGTINNNGNFQLNGGGATNTQLTLIGNTTLQGSGGTVTLSSTASGGGAAFIGGNGATLTNTNNIIQGDGIIGNGSLVLLNQAGGTVDANSTGGTFLTVLDLNGSGGVTNAGLLEATNQGVLEIQNTINNTGGNITANGSSAVVQLVGADIQGGTLNTKNGGTFITRNGNSATLDGKTQGMLTLSKGSTYTSDFNTTTNVVGTISNNGNFQINGGSATNTTLNLSGNTTLQGSGGTVTLNTIPSGGGAAFIQGNTFTLTNSSDTIQGSGIIGNGSLSLINNSGGTVFADVSGQTLLINGSGKITNNGTFKVASGAAMHVQNGAFTNFAGTTLTGGTYNTAGTLQIDELGSSGGEIVTNAASIILSGTSSNFVDAAGKDALSAFNNNATNGSFTINSGRNFTTAGNFTNNGILTVGSSNSTFDVNGNLTNFSGTTLTGGTYNVTGTLQFNGANIATNDANISLSGTSSTIVNQSAVNALANFAVNNGSFGISSGRNFTTVGNFTNNGTLTVGSSNSKFDVNGNLTNFSGTTLTGGTYNVTGTLQFNGANIATNDANIFLSGTSSTIVNQSAVNALANFAVNNGSFGISSGRNFTTVGNFTNNGTLTVGSSNSKFDVNGNLANFSGSTLTGGTYNVTGTLQFNGANIVTNAASIALSGTSSKIIDQSGNNALMNFSTNAASGSFSLLSGRTFSTTANFNNAGALNIASGTSFTVGGTGLFTQTGGLTKDDGTLTDSGGLSLSGGSIFGKGTISGNISNTGGIVNPGDSTTTAGILTDKGSYSQGSSGTLDIFIDGTTAGTKFDQLNVTSASLNGTLNINLPTGFTPTIGQTFKIMNFTSETGQFLHCTCAINGSEHFAITYQGTDVLLTVVAGGGGNFSRVNMLSNPTLLAGSKLRGMFGSVRPFMDFSKSERMGALFSPRALPAKPHVLGELKRTSMGGSHLPVSFAMPSKIIALGNSRILSSSSESRTQPTFAVSNVRSSAPRTASGGMSFQPLSLSEPSFTANYRHAAFDASQWQSPWFRMAASSSFNNLGVAVPHNDFRKLWSGAGMRENAVIRAFSSRPEAAAMLAASREFDGPALGGHHQYMFGNTATGVRQGRAGTSGKQGRYITGGASWSLSNLLSKPNLGFTVQ